VKLKGVISSFRRDCAAFGLWNTLQAFGVRAVQRVFGVKVLRAMYVSAIAPAFAAVPADLTARFLDRDTLEQLSADTRYELSPGFLDAALSKGDECYAIMDGARLAAYGWYARTPTHFSDDLRVHFDDGYLYMYKALTLDPYRGRRLHAIGKLGNHGLVERIEEGGTIQGERGHPAPDLVQHARLRHGIPLVSI